MVLLHQCIITRMKDAPAQQGVEINISGKIFFIGLG
jgi:hypothetical protein